VTPPPSTPKISSANPSAFPYFVPAPPGSALSPMYVPPLSPLRGYNLIFDSPRLLAFSGFLSTTWGSPSRARLFFFWLPSLVSPVVRIPPNPHCRASSLQGGPFSGNLAFTPSYNFRQTPVVESPPRGCHPCFAQLSGCVCPSFSVHDLLVPPPSAPQTGNWSNLQVFFAVFPICFFSFFRPLLPSYTLDSFVPGSPW